MSQRTKIFKMVPWVGGINTSVDSGVLSPQELVTADNVQFSSTGARIKREAFEYIDPAVPAPVTRSSSGTTRTLIFAADALVTADTEILVVGEKITVAGNTNYAAEDVAVLSVNDLTGGIYSITYTATGSLSESATAASGITITRASSVIAQIDFWHFDGSANTQLHVYATDDFQLFKLDASGHRKEIPADSGANVPNGPLTTVRFLVFNNRLHIRYSGLGNTPSYYDPEEDDKYHDLPNAPDASFAFEWQGRVWCNDKTDPDRLHFCETFDDELWQGIGDSGALFVGAGDGDPEGITNGYKYKDLAVVSKKTKRYRITGDSPENYYVELISEGLGNEGSMSIPVDETDVAFLSKRGIHSQAATDTYGDTASKYISSKIKPTFSTWSPSKLRLAQGAFIPELNSIALSITEEGQSEQNAVWLYNIGVQIPGDDSTVGAWYRWPDVSCQSLTRRLVSDQFKLCFGTSDGRIIQAQRSNHYTDFGTDGIAYKIRSGTIYVDGNSQTMKAFKKISLLYRPRGNFTFTVSVYIDNFPAQSFGFNQISGLDLLGETFVLGSSLLGSSKGFAPFTFSMDGIGRGIVIEINQPTKEEQIEVWGLAIEYEDAGSAQEVV